MSRGGCGVGPVGHRPLGALRAAPGDGPLPTVVTAYPKTAARTAALTSSRTRTCAVHARTASPVRFDGSTTRAYPCWRVRDLPRGPARSERGHGSSRGGEAAALIHYSRNRQCEGHKSEGQGRGSRQRPPLPPEGLSLSEFAPGSRTASPPTCATNVRTGQTGRAALARVTHPVRVNAGRRSDPLRHPATVAANTPLAADRCPGRREV